MKIHKKSTKFMSFSDPTPQKNRLKSHHIDKNQPRLMQQTLIIHLRFLAMHPSKTLPSSKVTKCRKEIPSHGDVFLITTVHDVKKWVWTLRRWTRRVPEVIWFWLSRSSVWTSAPSQWEKFAWKPWGILVETQDWLMVGQFFNLLTKLLGD